MRIGDWGSYPMTLWDSWLVGVNFERQPTLLTRGRVISFWVQFGPWKLGFLYEPVCSMCLAPVSKVDERRLCTNCAYTSAYVRALV